MTLIDRILAHPDVVKQPNSRGEAVAWCPWHADKSGKKPNLGINVQKKAVKCWVCGEPTKEPFRSLAEKWDLTTTREPRGEITATYDYRDESGLLLFQVVRFKDPDGSKRFVQRRPDSKRPREWIWSLGRTRRVPYRLPELLETEAGSRWIYITEGEKDADLLVSLGLVATTNPQGAGKWRPEFNAHFRDHKVSIIADNDPAGMAHATQVAGNLVGIAADVRVIDLEGLPARGDVSDWLGNGHQLEDLVEVVESTEAFRQASPPVPQNGHAAPPAASFWEPPKWRGISAEIVRRMKSHGFFVRAEGFFYFFDRDSRTLCDIDSFDMAMILNERYDVNETDRLYNYLVKQLAVEATVRGSDAIVRQFAYYDVRENVVYLNMNSGSVLKLDGQVVEVVENGSEGVLFATTTSADPWKYQTEPTPGISLAETIIEPINFVSDESTPHSADEQRLLLTMWILSAAFESVQPTKPLALAVGPAGSGKSSLFRRIGQLLFGKAYQVDALRRDKEDDFWTTVTTRPWVTFDNVDGYFPWLNDALAQSSTGVQVTKRRLHTTNDAANYIPRCTISLTARTPTFRREDVASRLLLFHMDRIGEKRPEFELIEEVVTHRDALMSDFANSVNAVLRAEPTMVVDPNIRLADFARIAARVGWGLGAEDLTVATLGKLRQSQYTYATEENPVYLAVDAWLPLAPPEGTQLGLDKTQTNDGRRIYARDLYRELTVLCEQQGMPWFYKNEISMGKAIRNMSDELGMHFEITWGRDKVGRWFAFSKREDKTPEELPVDKTAS